MHGFGFGFDSAETFALFMQPDTSQVLSETDTFGSFSKRIFAKHYDVQESTRQYRVDDVVDVDGEATVSEAK